MIVARKGSEKVMMFDTSSSVLDYKTDIETEGKSLDTYFLHWNNHQILT